MKEGFALGLAAIALSVVIVLFLAWAEGGCTPQERALALSANEAVCAVSHAVKGKGADLVAAICNVELPVAEAVVSAVKDAGTE